jgi:hypothetical protein
MIEEVEPKAIIIPKNDYKEELENEVMVHLNRINNEPDPQKVTRYNIKKKYNRIVIPEFKAHELRERLNWEMEEIRRCIEGYDGLPGRYYHFFNHVKIKHKKKGPIRPDFRTTQMMWAKTKERIMNSEETGIVMIKRRQVGMSWDMAADNIYDAQFHHEWDIGMNSKSDADSKKLFWKHKFVHRNQSPFLRGMVHVDRRDAMIFGKWVEKEKQNVGTMSTITSVAPTPTAHAGNQYRKLVMDEAGETDIISIWANAEDTLMQDGVLLCSPFIFGTMGDTDTIGQGLMEFWNNHKAYSLERFAFWGYNCLIIDDFGNDNIEDSLRWIIYERKRRETMATKIYKKFIQKYPITEEDAFLSVSGAGVGDPILLQKQRQRLVESPPLVFVGNMVPKLTGIASPEIITSLR